MAGAVRKHLMILGSGKMARNIGAFFLQQGYAVTWMTGGENRVADLEKHVHKVIRRFARVHGVATGEYQARFCVRRTQVIHIEPLYQTMTGGGEQT